MKHSRDVAHFGLQHCQCQHSIRVCEELTDADGHIWLEMALVENTGSKGMGCFSSSPSFRLEGPKGIFLARRWGHSLGKTATHVNRGLVIQADRFFLSMDN